MKVLAFDTSSADIYTALLEDGNVIVQRKHVPQDAGRQEAASKLLPYIDSLLKEFAWDKRDIDLIVVGVGPGSFTGVRVAVITARTLGQALGVGVIPVSNLEVIAKHIPSSSAIVLSAGGGQFFAAAFGNTVNDPPLLEPLCAPAVEVAAKVAQFKQLVLSADADSALFLANGNNLLPYPEITNFAADAAVIAWEKLQHQGAKLERQVLPNIYPWDNVLPLYLRKPSVTLKAGNGSSAQTTGRC